MKKYITVAALLVAGTAFANAALVDAGDTMIQGGRLYAGEFTLEFTWVENTLVSGDYDILAAYYQVNTNSAYTVNGFQLASDGTLSLVRGNNLTLTEGALTNNSTMGKNDYSTFKGVGSTEDYVLQAGSSYTVKYLGGANGSAAADLYVGGVKVASFTEGSHNMNGAEQNSYDATNGVIYLKENSAYSANYKVEVIPEPSAFGLLAGIGALALVASRRRRK